ncbi:MAG: DNA-binding domain-containing protein [Bacteroidota bacterium]|nr:DNA-binding domain-containing protein [Bacteroidota bacterium]
MATNGKGSVIVELYDNPLTERKDDRIGRVVTSRSYSEDDIIAEIVARRTDLSASTIKASLNLASEIALEKIANGASVSLGLGYFGLSVNGVFIGDNAKWDANQHNLSVRITPTAKLRDAVKSSSVDIRGLAAGGLTINSLTDVSSGEVNSRITPGGGVNLTGTRIKIDGENPANGITLTNQQSNEVVAIPKTSLLVNDPSKITFIVPSGLVEGDYKLTITTQFSSATTSTKEPRTYTFEFVLNVQPTNAN